MKQLKRTWRSDLKFIFDFICDTTALCIPVALIGGGLVFTFMGENIYGATLAACVLYVVLSIAVYFEIKHG